MIVVTNRIPVAKGHEIDFEDRFRNRVHLVESSVADNCSVQGENPRTVVVPSGGLVDTVFDVTCGLP